MIVVGYKDGECLTSYDASTHEVRYELKKISCSPLRVAKLSELEFVVSPYTARRYDAFLVFDAQTGRKLRELPKIGKGSEFWGLETIPSIPRLGMEVSHFLAGGGDSGTGVVLMNAQNGCVTQRFTGTNVSIRSIRYVREWNDAVFVGGGTDAAIRLYDLTKAQPLRKLAGHGNWSWGLDADVPSSLLYSVSTDTHGKAWSRDTYECTATFPLNRYSYMCRCVPDLHLLLVGQYMGKVTVCDTRKTDKALTCFKAGASNINAIARVDHDVFVTASKEVVWWRPDGKILHSTESRHALSYGICSIGTEFDRPVSREMNTVEDFDERCGLLSKILGSTEWLARAGGTVVVRKTGLCLSIDS